MAEEYSGALMPLKRHVCPAGVPFWKRLLDCVLILATSPIWLPLMFLLAVAIKVLSPGPVLFKQERVGYRGSRFLCFKFRTMHANAPTASHQQYLKELMRSQTPMTKMDRMGDPRLIPLGALLRASGLDELPQIFNVLRGEMSLVGPRPCTAYEFSEYRPSQMGRFETAPGLTGLWQVKGKNKTTFEQMVNMDAEYARSRSFWLDVGIILRTGPALLGQLRDLKGRPRKAAAPPAEFIGEEPRAWKPQASHQ